MAIYTKYGEKVINQSLRVDRDCMFNDKIVRVWATLEGQTAEKQYWISDLIGDKKKEVRDVINSNWENGNAAK
ncbi:MAG TPA: hypothetical protein VKY85_25940 [Candidatus Angelobacter sp.]|nr:hypothetical protein [Candidatus Angelobacter sp.]